MKLICKLFRLDPDTREGIISGTSILGIIVNLLVAATKVILGVLASSIAIISEGVNNASDALTSVLTLVGTKLAGKKPDKNHPFGYGRIEYLTSLVIALLILVTGVEVLTDAVKLIIHPDELNVSVVSVVAVALSAVVKFFLGLYTIRMGKKADSGALTAVGMDCRNDSFVSLLTIVSALIFLIFDLSLDAYAGLITSLLILKAGFEVLRDTVADLLGRPGEEALASALYHEIRQTEGVLNAADMMLHNYGPEAWSGSVNLEIDHDKTVGEMYEIIHNLQLRIMREHHVTMVFGIYAVDNDHEEVKAIRKHVGAYVQNTEHVKSFHAIYLDHDNDHLYCDLVVDYQLRDWDALKKDFLSYMAERCPGKNIVLTVETEFV